MTTPCQKSSVLRAGFYKVLMAFFVIGFLLAPRAAQAQYNSSLDLNVLRDAINGNATAISTLNSALGNPSYPTVSDFIASASGALGGAANATTLINAAIGGDAASLSSIQNALGGSYYYQNYYYYDGDGYSYYYLSYPNQFDDVINFIIAGQNKNAINTLIAALSGDSGAVATLSTVLYNPPNMSWSIFSNLIINSLGGSASAAITTLQAARDGDATATQQLNTLISSIVLSGNYSGYIDAEGKGWLTTLTPSSSTNVKDTDGDGIPDNIDPDIDNDGIPNALDSDMNGDGVVDNPDTDGDGIPDAADPTPSGGNPTNAGGTGGGTGSGGNGGTGTPGGGATPPTNDCDPDADAPLTGSFGTDPCALTEDTLKLVDDDYYDVAGQQFVDHLNDWWTSAMLPSMKNMTAQWHASVLDQSRQFGSAIDSHDVTGQIKTVQTREVEAKKAVLPSERACVGASASAPLANTGQSATVMANALTSDVGKRSSGAPGTTTASGNLTADTLGRLKTYCDNFNDPDTNAGANICPTSTAGPLINGDIDVEGFLLKDTVDLKKPEQFAAAKEIITNLIDPKPIDKLPDDVVDTTSGHEYLLRKEHVKALRAVASQVVAAIISRRVSIPLPKTAGGAAPPATPPAAPPAPVPASTKSGGMAAFRNAICKTESGCQYNICSGGGYLGRYQFGTSTLKALGCISSSSTNTSPDPKSNKPTHNCAQPNYHWVGGPCATTGTGSSATVSFLNCSSCQDDAEAALMQKDWNALSAGEKAKACTTAPDGTVLSPSGMLAAMHLGGSGALKCYLGTGTCGQSGCYANRGGAPSAHGAICCSGGYCYCPPPDASSPAKGRVSDGNCTLMSHYINLYGGYDTGVTGSGPNCGSSGDDTSTATGTPPKPPRPVGDLIREIRERAGVDPALISDDPSYNEIMLAMTKERFLDPDYYTRMANDVGAIKQEETSVRSYISIQLQDIYTLQEQINALMAARSAMKLEATGAPNESEAMPVR